MVLPLTALSRRFLKVGAVLDVDGAQVVAVHGLETVDACRDTPDEVWHTNDTNRQGSNPL